MTADVASPPRDRLAPLRISLTRRVARPERLALPDLAIDGPRSFFVAASGGLGDVFVALQVALAFEERVRREGGDAHEWALGIVPVWHAPLARLVAGLGLFDRVTSLAEAAAVKGQLRHEPVLLPALLGENDDDACLSIGTTADYLWALWGMRGRFVPAQRSTHVSHLQRAVLAPQFEALRSRKGLPARGNFVLLTPESSYLGRLKAWPVESWRALVREVHEGGDEVVLCARGELFEAIARGAARPCFGFDFSDPALSSDTTSFASVVDAARATVSLDSGPAHLASLLDAPCVSLWGPTSPALYASPSNVVFRSSLCPPCSTDGRWARCSNNVCMKGIEPAVVAELVRRLA